MTVLFDEQPGQTQQPFAAGYAEGRITGVLPEKWNDQSSWCKAWINYSRQVDEGRSALRVDLTRLENGQAQLARPLLDDAGEAYYRLTFVARSRTDTPVVAALRIGAPTYRHLWTQRYSLGSRWQTFTTDFRAERPAGEHVDFFFYVSVPGQADIAQVRLVKQSRAELERELRAIPQEKSPKNLVRVSRFPLGLQSGWAIGRDFSDGDEVKVETEIAVKGPSGFAPMKITTTKRASIWSAPFAVVRRLDEHTGSIYLKGQGRGRLVVTSEGRDIAGRDFELKGIDWQRVECPFKPDLLARYYALRIEIGGNVLADALQVNTGPAATAYVSQLPCEVSLAAEGGDAAAGRIVFDDERAVVLCAVTGGERGWRAQASVTDLYGRVQRLAAQDLTGEAIMTVKLPFVPSADAPLGAFRIEAWVEDAKGQQQSASNELVLYRLRRPRHWGEDAPESPFGAHSGSTNRALTMAKAIGVNWMRLHDAGLGHIGWNYLEPEQGKWTFFDADINRYRAHHLTINAELGTAPKWASYWRDIPFEVNGYFGMFMQPKDFSQYGNYVRTVVGRYKQQIDTWFVWNEPWCYGWWNVGAYKQNNEERYFKSPTSAMDFARLQKTAWENLKVANPDARLIGINTTTSTSRDASSVPGAEWTEELVGRGALETCNLIDYHQYVNSINAYPGDEVEQGFAWAMGPVKAKLGRIDRPVWMSEGSAGREWIGAGMYKHTLPYDHASSVVEAGNRDCRFVLSLLASGAEKVFLYSMHSTEHFGRGGEWSVFVGADGYLDPSAAAFSTLTWHLEDTRFVRRLDLTDGVYGYVFGTRDGKRSICVISTRPGARPWPIPDLAGTAVCDLFGNPLQERMAGRTLVYLSANGRPEVFEPLVGAR